MACCCSYLLQHSVSELLQRDVCSERSMEPLWVWPTLIIFHSIFDTIGESCRPFVLTLLLVMCQNLALTHPNFYLRLGLLSSEKTQRETMSPLKTSPALASHYFTSALQLLEVAAPSLRPWMDLHWRKGFHKMQLFWRYSKCHTERYHSHLCVYSKTVPCVYILVEPTVVSLMVLWL